MNKSDTVAVIRSILSSSTALYSISNLNKEFKNETGIDIPLFGYTSISDFLQSLADDVKLTGIYPIQQVALVTNEKSGHIVSLVKRQRPGKQQKKFSNKNKSSEGRTNTRFTGGQGSQKIIRKENVNGFKEQSKDAKCLESKFISCNNWLCSSESIPLIDLKQHACLGEYIEVSPCKIISPCKFYFHFRKFKKKLGDFMNCMKLFYSSHKEVPKIIGSLIKRKQLCVVYHKLHEEMQWCRAEIIKIVSCSHVVVDFIDFGIRAEIPKEKLTCLHKNFISLPRQACRGFLANIKPLKIKSKWSVSATQRFRDLALQKDLVAGVVCMDNEDCSLGLALSSTKGSEIHINDTLVKEGYAEFETESSNDQFIVGLYQDNTFNKSKAAIDDGKREHLVNRNCSHTQSPVFYDPNVYNTNSRLIKMFSSIKGSEKNVF